MALSPWPGARMNSTYDVRAALRGELGKDVAAAKPTPRLQTVESVWGFTPLLATTPS
jgi:hypothetical protein